MGTKAEDHVTMLEQQPRAPRRKAAPVPKKPVAGRQSSRARKATYALEASQSGRPSRQSTRKSANRAKPGSNLERQQTRAHYSPEAQASRARASPP